ncbi:hypothetical protein C8R43DRAFT_954846 [Mycena crocata]|nr:hypothetical protein C8R43DRAFT_954846 [Mycena crocata]
MDLSEGSRVELSGNIGRGPTTAEDPRRIVTVNRTKLFTRHVEQVFIQHTRARPDDYQESGSSPQSVSVCVKYKDGETAHIRSVGSIRCGNGVEVRRRGSCRATNSPQFAASPNNIFRMNTTDRGESLVNFMRSSILSARQKWKTCRVQTDIEQKGKADLTFDIMPTECLDALNALARRGGLAGVARHGLMKASEFQENGGAVTVGAVETNMRTLEPHRLDLYLKHLGHCQPKNVGEKSECMTRLALGTFLVGKKDRKCGGKNSTTEGNLNSSFLESRVSLLTVKQATQQSLRVEKSNASLDGILSQIGVLAPTRPLIRNIKAVPLNLRGPSATSSVGHGGLHLGRQNFGGLPNAEGFQLNAIRRPSIDFPTVLRNGRMGSPKHGHGISVVQDNEQTRAGKWKKLLHVITEGLQGGLKILGGLPERLWRAPIF